MAKAPQARLGSNPFAESALPWIRDTTKANQPSPQKDEPQAPSQEAAASDPPSAEPKKTGARGKPVKARNTVKHVNVVKQVKHVKHEIRGASAKDVEPAPVTAVRAVVADEPRRVGRPKSNHRVISKSSQAGLPDGWTRATITIREDMLETLKRAAYWERTTIKKVIDEALTTHLNGKTFKPIPTEGE